MNEYKCDVYYREINLIEIFDCFIYYLFIYLYIFFYFLTLKIKLTFNVDFFESILCVSDKSRLAYHLYEVVH